MTDQPRYNQRKARCADCKRLLQKGEGLAQKYPMFSGDGQYYYLCAGCARKRKEKESTK
jgi:hypothetical protein